MKFYKILFLLSLFLISCSSDDNDSDDSNILNSEFEITFSGNSIGTSSFNDINVDLSQQCATLEFQSIGTGFEDDNIVVDFFVLRFGEVSSFQFNNPGEAYIYNGPSMPFSLEPIDAFTRINSELYDATNVSVEVTTEPYPENDGPCATDINDYRKQIFNINFTITLEHENNSSIDPITISGNIIDFPINPDLCGC